MIGLLPLAMGLLVGSRYLSEGKSCGGCGIMLSDGYTLGCDRCACRRYTRLRRGEVETPTGFPGEAIDNTDPRGRLVYATSGGAFAHGS